MNEVSAPASRVAAMLSLAALNALSAEAFTEALGDIYEHAPWAALGAARYRPFETVGALQAAMARVVATAPLADRRALLGAHPELGQSGPLTAASKLEQRHSGVHQLGPARAATLVALNARYRERFGFPFIVAVRGQKDIDAIIEVLRLRLDNSLAAEQAIALGEVVKIAGFRLERKVQP